MQFFRRQAKPEHLELEVLSLYLDKELRANRHAQVEEHLDSCLACRHEFLNLQEIVDLLRSTPTISVPRSFTLLAPVISGQQVLRTPLLALKGLAAAVAVALMVIVIGDSSGIFSPSDSSVRTQLGMEEPVPAIRVGTESSPGRVLSSPAPVDSQISLTLEAQQPIADRSMSKEVATGDGVALAHRAGAEGMDWSSSSSLLTSARRLASSLSRFSTCRISCCCGFSVADSVRCVS